MHLTIHAVTDLPPGLVAAFEATLSELKHADVLLHVRDVSRQGQLFCCAFLFVQLKVFCMYASSPNFETHRDVVIDILRSIGVSNETLQTRTLEVWNKIDLVSGATP
eukprot:SAG31_NODE_31933_length_362_cov_0.783270_1_plen_107_part_00